MNTSRDVLLLIEYTEMTLKRFSVPSVGGVTQFTVMTHTSKAPAMLNSIGLSVIQPSRNVCHIINNK